MNNTLEVDHMETTMNTMTPETLSGDKARRVTADIKLNHASMDAL